MKEKLFLVMTSLYLKIFLSIKLQGWVLLQKIFGLFNVGVFVMKREGAKEIFTNLFRNRR